MPSFYLQPSAARLPSANILLFAGLFWIFTFAALSVRTEMLLGDAFNLFTVRRVLGTTVGAIAFAFVLDCIACRARDNALNPASAIAAVLPASLIVLGARLAIDQLFYDLPLPLETNLKWVMVWAGYFGMWVSAALAFQMHRQIGRFEQAALPAAAAPAAASTAEKAATLDAAGLMAWEWTADVLAAELSTLPEADRNLVAARLIARAGYETADDPLGVASEQQMRMALARRIAARLSA